MNLFLIILFCVLANIGIFAYSILSKTTSLEGWKIMLIPILLFPIMYFVNLFFSLLWITGNKTSLSIAAIGILNLGVAAIVFLIGDIIYSKTMPSIQVLIGSLIVVIGAAIISWK